MVMQYVYTMEFLAMFPFLFLLPGVAMGCSCPLGPRLNQQETIRSDFCRRGAGVFSAVVLRATCNCVPSTANNTYHCEDFTLSSIGVTEETISRAVCANVDFVQRSYTVLPCSQTVQGLAGGYEVVNVTQSPPPVQNVTVGRYCELTCPFNNATATLDPEVYGTPDTQQPCVYTVRITEVFQGNFTVDNTLAASGPLVVTSCGNPGRLLRLGEQYLVGIGQPASCDAFSEWSALSTYTESNIQYLRDLRTSYQMYGPLVCPSGASTCTAVSWLALGFVLCLVCGSNFAFS